MKSIFDKVSQDCSKSVTNSYSTSFSLATKMLSKSIRQDIYNIYGFVRFADEIVDTFHDYNKKELLNRFIDELNYSLKNKISTNPILNSFQSTVNKYKIDYKLIDSFLKSMKMDLKKVKYNTEKEYKEYIYGSADVVGLMCLKVFLSGNEKSFKKLKHNALALVSALQKFNLLIDLNDYFNVLNRTYFQNLDFKNFNEESKKIIMDDIENDFKIALNGIYELPNNSKFGVYAAYKYYKRLLNKLKRTSHLKIKNERVRVPNYQKVDVLARSYVRYRLNIL
jgi:phytoene/squalene synthetase